MQIPPLSEGNSTFFGSPPNDFTACLTGINNIINSGQWTTQDATTAANICSEMLGWGFSAWQGADPTAVAKLKSILENFVKGGLVERTLPHLEEISNQMQQISNNWRL